MSQSVLIVDDSGYARSTLRRTLEEAGYDVVGEAPNGVAALDQIVSLEPDLVTLDNILPDMTGLDILKALGDRELKSKIMMISAVGQQSTIEDCLNSGASIYLIKPYTSEQLLVEVKKLLNAS